MTKAEIIGEVLLKISGGKLTTDNSVRYGETSSLLAPAINYVMTGNYFLEKRDENNEKTINPLLIQSFDNIPVQYSVEHKRYYSILPKRVISLPKGRALQYVGTMNGKKFIPLQQGDEGLEEYYAPYKRNVTSYLMEGNYLWFYNLPPALSQIKTRQIVHVNDIADDEEIILPSNGYMQVINLIVEFLTGQRQIPKDTIIDGEDNITVTE